jgi:hypothetical protein
MTPDPSLAIRGWDWFWAVVGNWKGLAAVLSLVSGFAPQLLPEKARQWLDEKLPPERRRRRVLIPLCLLFLLYSCFQVYDDVSTRLRRISSQLPDFENVNTWSVSFKIGGSLVSTGRGASDDRERVIGLLECRFYNLSITQRRMIDLTLVIPTKDPEQPILTLNAQLDFFFKPKHVDGIIDLPIILEPNSKNEGRVEFSLSSELQAKINRDDGFDWLKYLEAFVYVDEHRSGKTVKVMVGESYDAATGTTTRP